MNENEIIMNENVVDEVMEVIPENTGVNFGKVAFGVLAAGAVVALGYKCYKLIKEKKAKKAQEAECVVTGDVIDFEPDHEESEE
jgi:hypothetical protein